MTAEQEATLEFLRRENPSYQLDVYDKHDRLLVDFRARSPFGRVYTKAVWLIAEDGNISAEW